MGAIEAWKKAAQARLASDEAEIMYAADLWGGDVEEFLEQAAREEFYGSWRHE